MSKGKVNCIRTLGVAELDGKLKLVIGSNDQAVSIAEFYGEDEAKVFEIFISDIFAALKSKAENVEVSFYTQDERDGGLKS